MMTRLGSTSIGKRIGAAALGVAALTGVAAATPSTAEAHHIGHGGGVMVQNNYYRGGGGNFGETLGAVILGNMISDSLRVFTNPCVLNPHVCGSPHGGVVVEREVIIERPVPVPVPVPARGFYHYGQTQFGYGYHFHDDTGHFMGQ